MRVQLRALLAVVMVLAALPVAFFLFSGANADPPTLEELGDPAEGRLAFGEGFHWRDVPAYVDSSGDEQFLPLDDYGLRNAAEGDYQAGVLAWSSDVEGESGTDRHIFALVDGQVVQLTEGESENHNPAVSPDGEWIAYDSYAAPDYVQHIRLVRIDGTGDRRLTSSEDRESWPTWSPDGSEIAYTALTTYYTHLWKMEVDDPASEPVLLFDQSAEHPAWSPDGDRIAFTAYVDNGEGSEVREVVTIPSEPCDDGPDIGLHLLAVCAFDRIVADNGWEGSSEQAAWTPAGLAFVGEPGDYDRVFHLTSIDDDPVIEPVSPGRTYEEHPTWRGDVGAIGYDTEVSPSRVWTSLTDGSDAQQHTDDSMLAYEFEPTYSPDGRRLAHAVQIGSDEESRPITGVHIENLDDPGAEPQLLVSDVAGESLAGPAYSPDGRYLAVEIWRLPEEDNDGYVQEVSQIGVFDLSDPTAPPVRLPHVLGKIDYGGEFGVDIFLSSDIGPSWSPGGDRLVFAREWSEIDNVFDPGEPSGSPSGEPAPAPEYDLDEIEELPSAYGSQLYVGAFPFDETPARRITGGSGEVFENHFEPAWSPVDPDTIVFVNSDELWTVDPNDCADPDEGPCANDQLPVDEEILERSVSAPAWSADGELLAFAAGFASEGPIERSAIWTVPATGGTATRITEESAWGHWYDDPAWQPTSDMTVHVEAAPDSILVGDASTVTITVSNLGRAASEATVLITLPPGLTLVSAPDGCTPAGDVCEIERMDTRTQAQIELVVRGAAVGTHQIDAEVVPRAVDPDASDNAASGTITVRPAPDEPTTSPEPSPPQLAITATVETTPGFVGGEDLTVTFTVTNTATSPAQSVNLTADLPEALTPITSSSGCSPGTACDIGDLAGGNSTAVVFTLPPVAAVDDTVSATVTATGADPATAEAPIVVLQPEIKVNPGLGPPGRPTQVTGTNFPPGADIVVQWGGSLNGQIREVTIAADGTFTTSLLVLGHDQLGPRDVVAESQSGPSFGPVEAPFLVVPGALGPPDFIGRR